MNKLVNTTAYGVSRYLADFLLFSVPLLNAHLKDLDMSKFESFKIVRDKYQLMVKVSFLPENQNFFKEVLELLNSDFNKTGLLEIQLTPTTAIIKRVCND